MEKVSQGERHRDKEKFMLELNKNPQGSSFRNHETRADRQRSPFPLRGWSHWGPGGSVGGARP